METEIKKALVKELANLENDFSLSYGDKRFNKIISEHDSEELRAGVILGLNQAINILYCIEHNNLSN